LNFPKSILDIFEPHNWSSFSFLSFSFFFVKEKKHLKITFAKGKSKA